jgi:hypothetical protein
VKLHRNPEWTVTWPTRPAGTYSLKVRAKGSTDAVRVASLRPWPTAPGCTVAFDYTPQVWRLRHPYRWRSRYVQGPAFPDATPGVVAFIPLPA